MITEGELIELNDYGYETEWRKQKIFSKSFSVYIYYQYYILHSFEIYKEINNVWQVFAVDLITFKGVDISEFPSPALFGLE